MEPMLNNAGRAPEETVLLEARQESLLKLVGELLAKNEQLRMKVAQLEELASTRTMGASAA
jgi:hypothetical protein